MGYIDNNLMSEEEIVYQAKVHWVVFLWPAIWLSIALSLLFFSDTVYAGGIFIMIAIVTGVNSIIYFLTSELGITNKRVMVKVGFIRRNSLEVLLNKVEGIQVNQSILGRIMGYGSIIIVGTGGTQNPFHKITAPLEFRKKTQEQIAIIQESK